MARTHCAHAVTARCVLRETGGSIFFAPGGRAGGARFSCIYRRAGILKKAIAAASEPRGRPQLGAACALQQRLEEAAAISRSPGRPLDLYQHACSRLRWHAICAPCLQYVPRLSLSRMLARSWHQRCGISCHASARRPALPAAARATPLPSPCAVPQQRAASRTTPRARHRALRLSAARAMDGRGGQEGRWRAWHHYNAYPTSLFLNHTLLYNMRIAVGARTASTAVRSA